MARLFQANSIFIGQSQDPNESTWSDVVFLMRPADCTKNSSTTRLQGVQKCHLHGANLVSSSYFSSFWDIPQNPAGFCPTLHLRGGNMNLPPDHLKTAGNRPAAESPQGSVSFVSPCWSQRRTKNMRYAATEMPGWPCCPVCNGHFPVSRPMRSFLRDIEMLVFPDCFGVDSSIAKWVLVIGPGRLMNILCMLPLQGFSHTLNMDQKLSP